MASPPPTTLSLPVVDLGPLLPHLARPAGSPALDAAAAAAVSAAAAAAFASFACTGLLLVRDPRAPASANDAFLDLLESYFAQPPAAKAADDRPNIFFQVGRTPPRTEQARDHCARARGLAAPPATLCPPEKDPKERFMMRVGPRPAVTAFPALAADAVVPAAFRGEWAGTTGAWGEALLRAAFSAAELLALGAGLDAGALTSIMSAGAHLLAPTGSDLTPGAPGAAPGTVLAAFHYDLNALTVHGKARHGGLYVWTRAGERLAVAVPDGCLLVQAGRQVEYVTGGAVLAGFHEVVVTPAAAAAAAAATAAHPGRQTWRVSSTLFAHFNADATLQPLGRFAADAEAAQTYPPVLCGDLVREELAAINLAPGSVAAQ